MEDEDQSTMAGRRRSRPTTASESARSKALTRLKARNKRETTRPSYDIKMDAPIYDTVDEDEYKTLVSKRRQEFSGFIVGDAGDDYVDDGEEEDWTNAGTPFSSNEEEEEGEKSKRKEKEKKPTATATATAALMGKQRISSMFTTMSVFKKRSEGKGRGILSSESVVDDVIAEFAPDDEDRQQRRRTQSKNLGLGLGLVNRVPIEKSKPLVDKFHRKIEDDSVLAPRADEVIEDDLSKDNNVSKPCEVDIVGGGDDREQKVVNVVETKNETELSKVEDNNNNNVFEFNAKFKEENKVNTTTFSAMNGVEEENGVGNNNKPVEMSSVSNSDFFVVEADGSLPFYILDAYEEKFGDGTVYLFGKVKAGNAYHSCCVIVKNIQRCVYAIPNGSVFHNEVVLKLEKDDADKKISAAEFRTKLHEVASGLKTEVAKHLMDLNVSTFSMKPVKRRYAFERFDIPRGENYVLKINYSFKDRPLSSDLKGDNFCALLGTQLDALELFLVKRKIKGPSWLSISKFSSCSSRPQVSWCKFEITVDYPKNIQPIQVSASTKNTAEIPPVIVSAISLKTKINEKENSNEIVSASIISCSKAKIDTPMLASEWKRPGVLSRYTVVTKLDVYPERFSTEVRKRNKKAGSTLLVGARSERDLLNCLLKEMYKIDSDVLVGHNISGIDLDVLLHRAKALNVGPNIWSKIGRLKRSKFPPLTKGSTVFGSGASTGILSCIAGRLLCDTYLCSRDLLKEVSYSLTELAKTQLNKDRKEIAPKDIPRMFQTTESLMDLIKCNETDACLSMELMFHLSILPLTRQLTNISGNLWGKTLQGARAQRVEYLLLHAFHARKYILPDRYFSRGKENKLTKRKIDGGDDVDKDNLNNDNEAQQDNGKGKKGPSYAGGLVLEPKRGLYDKYVLLLDFNSLYPSIIQEYNICFTTVERYPDGSVLRIPSSQKTGVLPELLKDLVERRRMVKSWMNKASGLKAQQFDIQQQALKLTANSIYGCLGFSNSRFYAKPLAELITLQGREVLQSTVDLVQNSLNLEVIYGDTDSIMIYSGLDDDAKAKGIARKVIQEVNKKYRFLEIALDGLYKKMLLLQKKKYAAVRLQDRNGTPYEVIERKGLDMVRRDWSLISKDVGDFCLSQILSRGFCEDVVESIHNYLMKVQEDIRKEKIPHKDYIQKYTITKSLTKEPGDYPDAKNQPHVQVALRLRHNGYATSFSKGDTVPYIICCEEGDSSGSSGGIAQRARHRDELNEENSKWIIDIDYYLTQQIHPVVSRLCAFIQGTDPARLADCLGLDSSKFQSKSNHITSNDPSSSLVCSVDDEDRYQGCQPLTLSCPSCCGTFDCPSISSSLCKLINKKPNEVQTEESTSNIWHRLHCPRCSGEGDVGRIFPAMIANQVKRQADGFISLYYKGLMTCDDESCKHTTRTLNLRLIGDSERGNLCPNYPGCDGRLVRKYSEVDLYKQLMYFCHILDTARCTEKVDTAARLLLEKELDRVKAMVDLAAGVAQKLRDCCAYGWVQLNDLCFQV